MLEHAEAFFARVAADAALEERLRLAEESYPGSLEIREAVVEDVLLPFAAALGYDFTLEELRRYETRRKLRGARPDQSAGEDEELEEPARFWLLDHGWSYDTDVYPDQPGRPDGGKETEKDGHS